MEGTRRPKREKQPERSQKVRKSRYVNLNVGGVHYTTSAGTLAKYPNSMLGMMFLQEKVPLAKDDQGRFIIDRDGTLFRHILNFLRDGELHLPKDFSEDEQLSAEARFYQLGALMDAKREKVSKTNVVHLNVGGTYYVTTKETLCKHEGSALRKMFYPEEELLSLQEYYDRRGTYPPRKLQYIMCMTPREIPTVTDREGRYVIDRNGPNFAYILDLLRNHELGEELSKEKSLVLVEDAVTYGLHEYVHAIIGRFETSGRTPKSTPPLLM